MDKKQKLFRAVFGGNLNGVEAALKSGTDVNARRGDGCTPLYFAASYGNVKLVRRLLEAGADPNAMGDYGAPLHAAAAAGALPILKLLVEAGADVNLVESGTQKNTPLHEAIYKGKLKAVELLLAAGASIKIINDNGFDALGLAKEFLERAVPLVKAAASPKKTTKAKVKAPGQAPAMPILATGKGARLFESVAEGLVRYAESHFKWFERNVGVPHLIDVGWDVPSRQTFAPIEELGITLGCEVEGDEERAAKKLEKAGFEGSGGEFYRPFGADTLDVALPAEKRLLKIHDQHPEIAGFFKNGEGQVAGRDYSIYQSESDSQSELEIWMEHVVASAVSHAEQDLRSRLPDCEISIAGHDGSGPSTFRTSKREAAARRKQHGYAPTAKVLREVLGELIGTPAVLEGALALAALKR